MELKHAAKKIKRRDVVKTGSRAQQWLQSKAADLAPQKVVNLMTLFAELIRDYIKRRYREVPFGTIAAITVAVVYVINPLDAIFDVIPIVGWVDDLVVVTTVVSLVRVDLLRYCEWRNLDPRDFYLSFDSDTR